MTRALPTLLGPVPATSRTATSATSLRGARGAGARSRSRAMPGDPQRGEDDGDEEMTKPRAKPCWTLATPAVAAVGPPEFGGK